jgi:hypothetical protein
MNPTNGVSIVAWPDQAIARRMMSLSMTEKQQVQCGFEAKLT